MSDSSSAAEGVGATTGSPAGEPVGRSQGTRGRTRTWIVVVLIVVALGIGAATVLLLVSPSAGIHSGAGSATFNWTLLRPSASNPTGTGTLAAFTGDIEGHMVTGTSALISPAASSPTAPEPGAGAVPVFRYRGSFAGSSFDVTVSYNVPPWMNTSAAPSAGPITMSVAGTYGTEVVRATVTSTTWSGGSVRRLVHFTGTIGKWKVAGTISPTTGTATHQSATAHFVVNP